ncbi:adenosylcobalamin-dependent ribonucleoside-diphosphate reductase [Fulvivirgaceae bacterium BMA12]|uniref:Vitamin B12-dependent ribonucleotide reductase n=1 Tax=Agaribacillus aureus TaxID=3051825 RepID=A0ABT8LC67_9BACT|nr:adenosylcobalamin-dependent ribonucleoside-diphosphate reductase [Fulvivirgaceae bacterium BMA12]
MKDAILEIDFENQEIPEYSASEPTFQLKPYQYDEVLEKAMLYFRGDELAANVWINKYALKDSHGNIYELTPDDMHRRMAREIARIEKKYRNPESEQDIYELFTHFKYLVPQGGSMAGIGNNFQFSSLSNCFVIGNEADSYGAILKTDEEQVQLMKRRGGVGHDLSYIRPKGSPVMNSALTATGIVPFMERYSNSTREVAQDGRRGALMLSLSIKHPDAEDFIDAKMDSQKVTGANVSIRIDKEFMEAVQRGLPYWQQYPIDSEHPEIRKEIDAGKLWQKIVHNGWKSAEPGILFWDTIIKESIPDCYEDLGFKTASTNPCGEIPLCPYDSCRLLAINLFSYVKHPFTSEAYFDFDLFAAHVRTAVRVLDDIIDLEIEKIDRIIDKINNDKETPEIKSVELNLWEKVKAKCVEGRRTGLGITGEGDMLAALGLRYGTQEATDFAVKTHKTLALEAYRSSVILARERGAFPVYESDRENTNPFIQRIKQSDPLLYEDMLTYGRRNISLLTIAPTGTTSLMTQTTSGIEPAFMVSYKRRRKINPQDKMASEHFNDEVGDAWEEYNVFHHQFMNWMKKNGYDTENAAHLEAEQLEEIFQKSPYYKATANDVDWVNKVKMQGAIQNWVDHSISVTVNVPNHVPESLISELYIEAWKSGCKGVTVYRDGSRSGVLVSEDNSQKDDEKPAKPAETSAPERPRSLNANVIRFQNNHERWIAVIGIHQEKPYEIFTGRCEDSFPILSYVNSGWVIKNKNEEGKSRYDFQYEDKDGFKVTIEGLSRCFNPEYWNYAKLISGMLRHDMPILALLNVVANLNLDDESLNTWKNGVVRALTKYVPDGTKPADNICPDCTSPTLVYEEGCLICKSCGHTKCS